MITTTQFCLAGSAALLALATTGLCVAGYNGGYDEAVDMCNGGYVPRVPNIRWDSDFHIRGFKSAILNDPACKPK